MREESEPLAAACGFSIDASLAVAASVFRHRTRNGVVETPVQCPKLVGADRGIQLDSQLGDGLTDVAIVVHDLRHRVALLQEFLAMFDRALADVGICRLSEAQGVAQLIQENWNAVAEPHRRRRGNQPRGHLGSTSSDDLVAMMGYEFVQHGGHVFDPSGQPGPPVFATAQAPETALAPVTVRSRTSTSGLCW